MRLEQLQAFLAIAETGSFQQAARKCGVTQSTISRQIQALEADLVVVIFGRLGLIAVKRRSRVILLLYLG